MGVATPGETTGAMGGGAVGGWVVGGRVVSWPNNLQRKLCSDLIKDCNTVQSLKMRRQSYCKTEAGLYIYYHLV